MTITDCARLPLATVSFECGFTASWLDLDAFHPSIQQSIFLQARATLSRFSWCLLLLLLISSVFKVNGQFFPGRPEGSGILIGVNLGVRDITAVAIGDSESTPWIRAKVAGSPAYQEYMKTFDRPAVEKERQRMWAVGNSTSFYGADLLQGREHREIARWVGPDTLYDAPPADQNNTEAVDVLKTALRQIVAAASGADRLPVLIGGISVPQYFNEPARYALRHASHELGAGLVQHWQIQTAITNIARTYRADGKGPICSEDSFDEWFSGPEKDMVVFVEHSGGDVDIKVTTLSFHRGRIAWESAGLLENDVKNKTNAHRLHIVKKGLPALEYFDDGCLAGRLDWDLASSVFIITDDPSQAVDYPAIAEIVEEYRGHNGLGLNGKVRWDVDSEYAGAVGAACMARHVQQKPEVLSSAYGFFVRRPLQETFQLGADGKLHEVGWTGWAESDAYELALLEDPFHYPPRNKGLNRRSLLDSRGTWWGHY
ncbi:hypothetical protein H2200_003035 [Cladophialophora chaetospira]|uniref:Uncharacterized protein n=1 Tax=Cladophialophora chaetospira TaxID=386627 RepID=A0AA38XGN8_9EURO|nr:hypothetical protein H2200_003035 [Cladophialophora chaetospira]